ncbi:hypothetical protein BU23DRAFT_563818 [Bimuria novae-zelandiae CBS 107.79]|uniref:Lysine-specific metallo-endopeptidase domain-containing protein n=1 Tax=Bimuria novae-zelandiae CBS 107.79 TaxID=1447943 RepID=A0A6A5VQV2_9PLEO|nr:hypothetical protein BU23DRAFT_563818 [Bimuria novae-zelandiae CBS 107.79]
MISRTLLASALVAAVPCASSIALPENSNPLLTKRGSITIDPRCSSYAGVSEGVNEAEMMSQLATDVLNGDMKGQWTNARNAFFGDTDTEKTHILVCRVSPSTDTYSKIANVDSTHDVTLWCANRWEEYKGKLAAHRTSITLDSLTREEYADYKAAGFVDGENLVLCTFALQDYTSLATLDHAPGPGQPMDQYKLTYGSMFVHEFSHIFGTKDSSVYAYDYTAVTQIVNDYRSNTLKVKTITPGTFADAYFYFALAVSTVTTPAMAYFDWSGGHAISVA